MSTRRIVYTDPLKTNKAFVIEYGGKYYLWNPPEGGTFKLSPNKETGDYDAVLVDSKSPGKTFNDVAEDMLVAKIFTGDTSKRYGKMAGKGPTNPFQVMEVLLDNLDRQTDILRKERDLARREAEEFKKKMEDDRANHQAEYNKTIAALQEELRLAKSPVLNKGK